MSRIYSVMDCLMREYAAYPRISLMPVRVAVRGP